MAARPVIIESTAEMVADELARRGIPLNQRVTIMIKPDQPDDWTKTKRRGSRRRSIFRAAK